MPRIPYSTVSIIIKTERFECLFHCNYIYWGITAESFINDIKCDYKFEEWAWRSYMLKPEKIYNANALSIDVGSLYSARNAMPDNFSLVLDAMLEQIKQHIIKGFMEDIDNFRQEIKDLRANPGKPQPARTPKQGYVYLLKSEDGYYKIGKALDPTKRHKTLAIQLPYKVELVHTIFASDYALAESQMHSQFAHKRLNGEWFDLTDAEVQEIKNISDIF